jgi:hypothetical protein
MKSARSILVLGLAGAVALPALGQGSRPVVPHPVVECRFEGWANDRDNRGQPVRSAPDPSAPVIGRLPPPVNVGLDELSVTVLVTGYHNGWFRVQEAGYADEVQGVPVPRRPVLDATGWVPVDGIKSALASTALKAQPARDAATVAALSGFRRDPAGGQVGYGPDGVAVQRLISCRGSWVEVATELGTGWADRVCARQLTACP